MQVDRKKYYIVIPFHKPLWLKMNVFTYLPIIYKTTMYIWKIQLNTFS